MLTFVPLHNFTFLLHTIKRDSDTHLVISSRINPFAMKKILLLSLLVVALFACNKKTTEYGVAYQALNKNRVLLPNGWSLTPVGDNLPLGDLPLNMVVSKDRQRMVVTNNGQSTQQLTLVDVANSAILDEITIPKSWLGLAMSSDGKTVYASGGNDNMIRVYQIAADTLSQRDSIVLGTPWPTKISPAGIALDEARQQMYVVTKEDSSLYVLNLRDKSVKQKLALGHEAYTCLLSPDQTSLYISLWGGAAIAIYDIAAGTIRNKIKVDLHPNDMTITQNGRLLYVACADDNSVAVIDLQQNKVVQSIVASLYPNSPTGSTTNGVALSEDEKMLFVANADNNCLAVFNVEEVGEARSMGFIPTGWYPTNVKVVGNRIFVANGKGFVSKPNPRGPNPYSRRTAETEYIGGLFKGSLSIIDIPDQNTLATYTQLVYRNTPYSKDKEKQAHAEKGNPIPRKVGDRSPIKYVFYVIKENRTYDQVFGDLAEGNGDPSLCLFPDSITPNQHALAREFVLLDNFYVDAEVSADGHNWSMAAYANDYVEKTWPTSYGGRGGTYDYEGSRKIAYPRGGFIWDYCKRAGVSYRTYGEFSNLNETYLESLKGHTAPNFPGYDLSIKDTLRFNRWKADFDSLIAINALPRFNTVRFGNDHTAGARGGVPTPAAMVADNDLAVGMFVEHISRSPIWKETAIFVLEDDAQNGPDHVDAHRSIALVVSPYAKRKHIESTMYSTSGMLRTIELILGLPPMSQFDAGATPMHACFTYEVDLTPFKARPNQVDLNQLNPVNTRLSRLSYELNLDKEDQAPDDIFSEIIWKTVRGEHAVMPAPRHSAFVMLKAEEEED